MFKILWFFAVILVISIECKNPDLLNKILPKIRKFSNVKNGTEVDLSSSWPGEMCNRVCVKDDLPRICYFKFHLEHYHAMGPACGLCGQGVLSDCFNTHCIPADGIEKGVKSINRQIPGPAIHVCQDDLIVVDVANHMAGSSSTIHWHGPHQRDTPYMDGVPFITQCPIEYSTTFRYSFRATEPGTQFYHSHSGHQKVDGHYGALIVHQPVESDPNSAFYDSDLPKHVMLISDWMHETADMFMPGLPTRPGGILPNNVLINGRGQFFNKDTNSRTKTPLQIYKVKPDKRYRFRFINSMSHVCPVQIQIEHHYLRVIASDSYSVQPREINTLFSTSGERYDFVLTTNQTPSDYWVRVRLVGPCDRLQIEQFAIIRYSGVPEAPYREFPSFCNTFPLGVTLNHPNTTCFDDSQRNLCITELDAHESDEELQRDIPDYKFYLSFDNHVVSNAQLYTEGQYLHFMNPEGNATRIGALNRITFGFPSIPLLTQREEIDEKIFCNEGTRPDHCNYLDICPCTHRLKVPSKALVELILVDETANIGALNHPFHLHGHRVMVTNMGQHPQGIPMTTKIVRAMERSRSLPLKPTGRKFPFKDTVSIPSRGFTVVRFRATNPGFWLLHCHFEWHMAVGMGLVLQVGEHHEMAHTPPNFPKCGNYLPDI